MDAVASATSLFNLSFFHFFHYFIEIFFYRFFQMKKVKNFKMTVTTLPPSRLGNPHLFILFREVLSRVSCLMSFFFHFLV